jgi:hypothetical protein
LSTAWERSPCGKQAKLLAKAKYLISPIVNQYREGKVKSREVIPVKQNLKPFAYKKSEPPHLCSVVLCTIKREFILYKCGGDGVPFGAGTNEFVCSLSLSPSGTEA